MEWSNKLGSRERKPWLLLIKSGEVTPFAGEPIPGVVAIVMRLKRRVVNPATKWAPVSEDQEYLEFAWGRFSK